MNLKNTKYLFEKYPSLFKPDPNMMRNLMRFGFNCNDGWFKIIDSLCEKIVQSGADVEVQQVKEKFGGLRFYVPCEAYSKVQDLIVKAEEESFRTCEDCGKEGKFRGDLRWKRTLCDKHYKARKSNARAQLRRETRDLREQKDVKDYITKKTEKK